MKLSGASSSLPPILERLEAAIGLDPGALEQERLQWILRNRCRALGLGGAADYERYLTQNPGEIEVLIDAVVVQETRFFRDPSVFVHLRSWLASLASRITGPLRILSAPCGTGQEAYSVAALLRLQGVPAQRFTIDALDISRSALASGRCGLYPERSVSHLAPDLQAATGILADGMWSIHPELRERVCFQRRNLADPEALAPLLSAAGPYHLILCRNLFIYLAPGARAVLARSLAVALAPSGRLILGTADRVPELSALFQPMQPAASFAFAHRVAAPQPAVSRPVAPEPGARPRPLAPAAPRLFMPELSSADTLLALARQHLRRGERARAERRCRQALYLEPGLLPALQLLESLWDRNPNQRHRRALRDRILRHGGTVLAEPPRKTAPEPA
jgi:chemotaxis protein methyltransferase WspC